MTPELIEAGARILSALQGCEDPLGQRDYYRGLFIDLIDGLADRGLAAKVCD
jgi:hypothetical protein